MTPQNLLSFLMPRPLPTPFVSTRPLQKSCWATTSSATTASRLGTRGGVPGGRGTVELSRETEPLSFGPFCDLGHFPAADCSAAEVAYEAFT